MSKSNSRSRLVKFVAIGFAVVLALTALVTFSSYMYTRNNTTIMNIADNIAGVYSGSAARIGPLNSNQHLNVLITLGYRNDQQLQSFLSALQNPQSPLYHKYLTAQQFTNDYSPSASAYNTIVNYFSSQGFQITTYNDRVTIALDGTVSQYDSTFHTSIYNMRSTTGRSEFYAPISQVYLPSSFAGEVVGIAGLSNQYRAHFNLNIGPQFTGSGSSEVLYGSDLQVPYQVSQLYQKGYPTSETIATILWGGVDASGNQVGAFVPSDISTYFQQTLPAGEPTPTIIGYPIQGAAPPGSSAANDNTQSNYESTLDLEMVGSMAPGATVVEVYGPGSSNGGTNSELDTALADILSPPTGAPSALNNVVAISNSWGGSDSTDSSWQASEQQAAARGITVLASSGDGGNTGSGSPSFPATVGFNTYGTLAVGGTTTVLSGSPSSDGTGTTGFQTQSVWYNTPQSGDGSQGGVSSVFAEPSWQSGSADANGVITAQGSGRGTPDIAAVGANMNIYITAGGSSGMQELWGTSVASPLAAGVVAVMDSYMGSNLGFMDPLVYKLGQAEVNGQYAGAPPFYFVANGSNGMFSGANGYSLAVGWGSINAYYFVEAASGTTSPPPAATTYAVQFVESGLPSGTSFSVTLNGATSSSGSGTVSFSEVNGSYSFSIGSVSGYTASPSSGTVVVSGSAVSESITFTASSSPPPTATTYAVQFVESGLPSGTSFSVTLNGATSSGSGTVSFSEVNGSYSFSVGSVSGYTASPSSGTVVVSGSAVSESITFTTNSSPPPAASVYSEVNASSSNTQFYTLPGAEEFTVANSVTVNYVVLLLEGSGTIQFSIGNSFQGTGVVGLTNINVNSNSGTYYLVSFPSVTLNGGSNYYLNVYDPNFTGVQWGYTTTSSASVNIGAVQDYWYGVNGNLHHDNSYPDIYTVGYSTTAGASIVHGSSMHTIIGGSVYHIPTESILFHYTLSYPSLKISMSIKSRY
ncbi:MAG: protease pro-enzyme activation domain-containing protein [Candidatus Thermoplasmatota archaeon]|nr:protease pro-enzyme activation domain-containing protein [Candidatus Thermoplasmatota archaeon]